MSNPSKQVVFSNLSLSDIRNILVTKTQQAELAYKTEIDRLKSQIAAIDEVAAMALDLGGTGIIKIEPIEPTQHRPQSAIKKDPVQPGARQRVQPKEPRKLNRPSGAVIGVPPRWTADQEAQVSMVDTNDPVAMNKLAQALDRSTVAITKRRYVIDRRKKAAPPPSQPETEAATVAMPMPYPEPKSNPEPLPEPKPEPTPQPERQEPAPVDVTKHMTAGHPWRAYATAVNRQMASNALSAPKREADETEIARFLRDKGATICPPTGSPEIAALPLPVWDPRRRKMVRPEYNPDHTQAFSAGDGAQPQSAVEAHAEHPESEDNRGEE